MPGRELAVQLGEWLKVMFAHYNKKYKNILIVMGIILVLPIVNYLGMFLHQSGQYFGTFYRNIYQIICDLAQNI